MKLISLENKNLAKALEAGIILSSESMEETLDKRLKEGLQKREISGEQWFRKPDIWYSITGYSNPYFTIHSELQLIKNNQETLAKLLEGKSLVFYGVGTGDTESEFVRFKLFENNHAEVIGIDAINVFLERYCSGLINLMNSNPDWKINYKGINNLFEHLGKSDLEIESSVYKNKAHICVGTTIGNFETDEILSLFSNLSKQNDILILGLHLDNNLEQIKERYENSYCFKQLITNFIQNPDINKVKILANKERKQIEGRYEDLLIFHSKKFNSKCLGEAAEKHGYEIMFECDDKNSCIMAFNYSGVQHDTNSKRL